MDYHPLSSTLRLYAGWLLAFSLPLFIVGAYQVSRAMPEITFFDEWLRSEAALQVTVLAFLYLLGSSIHRAVKGGVWTGIVLIALGFAAFTLVRAFT